MTAFAIVGDFDAPLVEAMLGAPKLARYTATIAELDEAGVELVLAFGNRAATALVTGFRSMDIDRGKPVLGASGKWMVMALPAAGGPVADVLADLSRVETLLMCEGLADLCQPAPPRPEWVDAIGFLAFSKVLKTGKCLFCGANGNVGAYTGNGLTWKLCSLHAWRAADWAGTQGATALAEHAEVARDEALAAKQERIALRMAEEYGKVVEVAKS